MVRMLNVSNKTETSIPLCSKSRYRKNISYFGSKQKKRRSTESIFWNYPLLSSFQKNDSDLFMSFDEEG